MKELMAPLGLVINICQGGGLHRHGQITSSPVTLCDGTWEISVGSYMHNVERLLSVGEKMHQF